MSDKIMLTKEGDLPDDPNLNSNEELKEVCNKTKHAVGEVEKGENSD